VDLLEAEKPVDFARLLDLIRAEWPAEWGNPDDDGMLAEMAKSYDASTDIVKCLVDGDRTVGWYRYSKWPRDDLDGHGAHTLDIAVLPERQGEGLGRLLMEDLVADCRRRGFATLMSRTFESNLASIGLHRATGFREAFRKGDSIIWELEL
jgi:L-amino acid N-acyltransferase YncA